MNNAKKGFKYTAVSIISQIVTLGLGIIIPRLVLVNLGSETNGLLNSIGTVLTYVALLEAGVGGAAVQSLYVTLGKGDRDATNQILAAVDGVYKRTGMVYLAVVLLLTFAFPFTFRTELPRITVMAVMLLSGLPGVVNFYFQGKFTLFLSAEGKSYVTTALSTVIHIFTSVSKIVLLLCGFDVIALQAMYLLFNLAQVAFIMLYMKRRYQWIDLNVKRDYDAIAQSKNVLIHQISGMIFNNTDVLLLTWFCGLKTVSVYSMYVMLYGIIKGIISHFGGFNFILGQTFSRDRERYLKLHDTYEIFNTTLTCSLFCIANIFILPFLKLYTAGITDIDYLDPYLPYLMVATYILSNGRTSSNNAINFAQHFKQTQWRSILESCINLTVSLIAVSKFGIYGVLIGTIAALLYRTNDMIIYANKRILNRSPWITYRRWLLNLVLFVAVTVGAKLFFAHIALDTYGAIIGWAVISCIVIIPIFFVVLSLCDRETYRFAKALLLPYAKAALAKLHRS